MVKNNDRLSCIYRWCAGKYILIMLVSWLWTAFLDVYAINWKIPPAETYPISWKCTSGGDGTACSSIWCRLGISLNGIIGEFVAHPWRWDKKHPCPSTSTKKSEWRSCLKCKSSSTQTVCNLQHNILLLMGIPLLSSLMAFTCTRIGLTLLLQHPGLS